MRFAWLVLLAAMLTLVSCSPSTPLAPTATSPAATLTPVPTQVLPTATDLPPSATPSPAPSATVSATPGGPTPTTGPTATPTLDPALAVIYDYLAARAAADVEAVTALACDAFDSQAVTEAISFRSMNAKLNNDLECSVSGAEGDYTLVACVGTMTTTYGPDSKVWDLSNAIYRAALENGAWTMCGYQ
ncbi:MAG: hypothetical protein IT317_13260 [Anaerolineales bacterium]|nr:hypothetical protein [Anaerolineales bacterium]